MLKVEEYHDLIWLKVKAKYNSNNSLKMTNSLSGNFRFSIWRDSENASSCECQLIVDQEEVLFPNQEKILIIVVNKTTLTESFEVGEPLYWGATQAQLGTIQIIKRYDITNFTMLYRPVNHIELKLIQESGFLKFPPRLPEQPIFYPVLNEEYATKIAKDWNVPAYGFGYVLNFLVDKTYLSKFKIQNVGGSIFNEYWIPSDELEEFNEQIIGKINVIKEFM